MTPPDALADPWIDAPAGRSFDPPRGALSIVRKYARIFRASLVERMAYRGDFLVGTLLRFLPMFTTILLWQAVFAKVGRAGWNGWTYNETIAYLLLTNISRMFSSMPGLAGGVAREIREGTLKRYLVQPVDLIAYLLAYRTAHKVAYIVTSVIPYAILFFVCRAFFDHVPTDATTWGAFLLALVLSFLVGFFFETCVGMAGFWFLEVTSLLYIVMTLNFFISGHMLPLDLLPKPWSTLLKALPFQYMAYFPAAVLLGKIKGAELAWQLFAECLWVIFFAALARGLYRAGLRRYSAFGG